MPLRDLLIASFLVLVTIVIAFVATAVESEFYLFIPKGRRFHTAISEPPTSPWVLVVLLSIATAIFSFSKRHARISLFIIAILPILGWAIGPWLFSWQPGIAQYLLMVSLGALAVYVGTNERFDMD